MKDEILREKLKKLSPQQLELINEYCENNMSKLKKISYNAFFRYGIPAYEHDELYDDAMDVLMESAINFDLSKGASFLTYLTNNIKRSVIDWYRDNYQRGKRKNLLIDKEGKIVKVDKDGNITTGGKGKPIIIPDISFDVPTEEDNDLTEKVASDFNVEDESRFNFNVDEKVEEFLCSLPKVQKNILVLRMKNFSADKIKQKLNISNGEYNNAMKSIKMNKGLCLFTKNKNDGNYTTEVNEMEDRIIEISESESYRTDKFSMYSLLQDKKTGDVNCNYILQREPFQWTPEKANRYFCRVLSNLPIPEIVICEQKKKGLTVAYLIDGLQRLSYAEAFKEGRIKIGALGAERHLIQYRDYEGCTPNGKHGDILNYKFLDTLHPYTELAINGNDMTHPDLIPFLTKLKKNKVIVNLTVNQIHFEKCQNMIRNLVDNGLIYGLGVSLVKPTKKFINLVKQYPNAVIHTINGILIKSDIEMLADNGLKMLILGYKNLRRGNEYYETEKNNITDKQHWLYENLESIIPKFEVVSFDNLALEQLNVKRLLTEEEWSEFFMGEDGNFTFYLDLVEGTFGKNSLATKRYFIMDNIDDMFQKILSE